MKPIIDSYYIDMNDVLHTFINESAHVTITGVKTDEQAKEVIEELNLEL